MVQDTGIELAKLINDYHEMISQFRRRDDWEGMLKYCGRMESELSLLVQEGQADERARRMHAQILIDMGGAYRWLDRPRQTLRMAHKALRALRKIPHHMYNDLSAHLRLAEAYEDNEQFQNARKYAIRAITSILQKRQIEFMASALGKLAELERREGRPEAADALVRLGLKMRRERRWAHLSVHRGGVGDSNLPSEREERT